MNQNRKDQDVPNRQSNMEQAEGSRDDQSRALVYGAGQPAIRRWQAPAAN